MAPKSSEPESGTGRSERSEEVRELVWILRRMMYVFITWAEERYGWHRARRDEDA